MAETMRRLLSAGCTLHASPVGEETSISTPSIKLEGSVYTLPVEAVGLRSVTGSLCFNKSANKFVAGHAILDAEIVVVREVCARCFSQPGDYLA